MRSALACVAVIGAGVLVVGSAAAHPRGQSGNWSWATGRITHLGRSHISVGHLTCLVPDARGFMSGDFALGERVTMRCIGDVLRLIKNISSSTSGANGVGGSNGSNGSSVIVSSGANGTSSNTSANATSNGQSNSTATATASSTNNGATTTSVSAEGPVTAITSTRISIGDATCPFDQASYPAGSFAAQLKTGEVAKITCTTYPDGTSSQSVSAP